jgi:hypothetical protein
VGCRDALDVLKSNKSSHFPKTFVFALPPPPSLRTILFQVAFDVVYKVAVLRGMTPYTGR